MLRSARRTPVVWLWHAVLASVLLALSVSRLARAQDSTAATRDGWIVGPLLGLPGAGSDYDASYVTLGLGVTRLVPNRPGLDFAIGTVPRAMSEGVLPIGLRIGPSLPIALGPDVFVIPSAGLSGIGAVGSDGGGAIAGFYWGAATVVARGPVGLRAGVTWHRPAGAEISVWLVEIGVMSVPSPRRVP